VTSCERWASKRWVIDKGCLDCRDFVNEILILFKVLNVQVQACAHIAVTVEFPQVHNHWASI
jgi:hypothetical protein